MGKMGVTTQKRAWERLNSDGLDSKGLNSRGLNSKVTYLDGFDAEEERSLYHNALRPNKENI